MTAITTQDWMEKKTSSPSEAVLARYRASGFVIEDDKPETTGTDAAAAPKPSRVSDIAETVRPAAEARKSGLNAKPAPAADPIEASRPAPAADRVHKLKAFKDCFKLPAKVQKPQHEPFQNLPKNLKALAQSIKIPGKEKS